ncbi:hypothetical protein EON66_02710 [archaeon]|nr:MAG: hypothetical protein EON66_02710 [archaeon]
MLLCVTCGSARGRKSAAPLSVCYILMVPLCAATLSPPRWPHSVLYSSTMTVTVGTCACLCDAVSFGRTACSAAACPAG